jgi:hypothetical protein
MSCIVGQRHLVPYFGFRVTVDAPFLLLLVLRFMQYKLSNVNKKVTRK